MIVKVNWHPYTQMKTTSHIPIVRGEGSYIYDADGKKVYRCCIFLVGNPSWACTSLYCCKSIRAVANLGAGYFAGFTHPNAIELSERLLTLLPDNQEKVFYTDNGSTAIEVALKMCLQFHYNRGEKRIKFLLSEMAIMGDTFGLCL